MITAKDPADGYDEMDDAALRDELLARTDSNGQPLPATGTRPDLVARLREDDAANARPAGTLGVDGTVHS